MELLEPAQGALPYAIFPDPLIVSVPFSSVATTSDVGVQLKLVPQYPIFHVCAPTPTAIIITATAVAANILENLLNVIHPPVKKFIG
jgi:hypothetical protein